MSYVISRILRVLPCKSLLQVRPASIQPNLTIDCFRGVVRSIIARPPEWFVCNVAFLEALLDYVKNSSLDESVVKPCPSIRDSSRARGISHEPRPWDLLSLIRLLLDKEMYDLSFSFLQTLLHKGIIPPQAIKSFGTETDPRAVILSVLLRTCAHYGWPEQALCLLRTENLARTEVQGQYTEVVNDLLSAFVLDDRTKIKQCSQLIRHVLSQNPTIELDSSLVRAFFKLAHSVGEPRAAATVFEALQSSSVRGRYTDGPLHGAVLPWLLDHLVYHSKKRKLGILLAKDLVKSTLPMNPYERGDVITLCAAGGFVTETHELWERYSDGPEGNLVAGHAKCMVRVVKLFKKASDIAAKNYCETNRAERNLNAARATGQGETILESIREYSTGQGALSHDIKPVDSDATLGNGEVDGASNTHSVPEGSSLAGLGASERARTRAGPYAVVDANDFEPGAADISKAIVGTRHDMENDTQTTINAEHTDRFSVSKPVIRNAAVTGEPEADEHLAFAHKVLNAFRSAKEPLNRASHYDLNALARASDVLGLVRQSMHALRIIIERKEVPDTRDLNVVIAAMATRDPLRAEAMLVRMLEEGMHMSAISFSTVIIEAIRRGDTSGASRVYSRALRVGHKELAPSAATALVNACLAACLSPRVRRDTRSSTQTQEHKEFLRQIYSLITTEGCAKMVATTRDLGARCVGAALQLGEAGMAFFLWRELVKGRKRWDSDEHKELRHAITGVVGKAQAKGAIGANEGTRMISELGGLP